MGFPRDALMQLHHLLQCDYSIVRCHFCGVHSVLQYYCPCGVRIARVSFYIRGGV